MKKIISGHVLNLGPSAQSLALANNCRDQFTTGNICTVEIIKQQEEDVKVTLVSADNSTWHQSLKLL